MKFRIAVVLGFLVLAQWAPDGTPVRPDGQPWDSQATPGPIQPWAVNQDSNPNHLYPQGDAPTIPVYQPPTEPENQDSPDYGLRPRTSNDDGY